MKYSISEELLKEAIAGLKVFGKTATDCTVMKLESIINNNDTINSDDDIYKNPFSVVQFKTNTIMSQHITYDKAKESCRIYKIKVRVKHFVFILVESLTGLNKKLKI
jgi:hypothetical protein